MLRHPFVVLAVASLGFLVLSGCVGSDAKKENRAPKASLKILPGADPLTYTLDGTGSTDPDGDTLTYGWNWVIGKAQGSKVQATFPAGTDKGDATFQVSLVVRDAKGASHAALDTIVFGKGENQAPKIVLQKTPRWVAPGTTVTMDASNTTDADRDSLRYEWIWGPRSDFNPAATGVEDACKMTDTTLATFTTGCLKEGQSFSLLFDKPGTYNIHCHPHPWMKGRIVVDAAQPSSGEVEVAIRDFGFVNETTTVGVGSTINFVNEDPVPHTATVEDWLPGTKSGGTSAVFSTSLSEGEYVARLIVNDGKGGRATQTWGLKASSDAPPNPDARVCNDDSHPLVQTARPTDDHCYYNITSEYKITATLYWDDPGSTGTNVGNLSIYKLLGGDTATEQKQCVAQQTGNSTSFTCEIPKDDSGGGYQYQVTATQGALTTWSIHTLGLPYSAPSFGNSAGDGHAHHH